MVQRGKARVVADRPRRKAGIRGNVILVDDDILVRAGLKRLLRGVGYRVEAFGGPSDLLTRVLRAEDLLTEESACLLLDIVMPEMNGAALWQELRIRGYSIPTIFMTGRCDVETLSYSNQVDAVTILYKPIEEQELFAAIERALAAAPRGGS